MQRHWADFQFLSQQLLYFSQPGFKFRLVVQRAFGDSDVNDIGFEQQNGGVTRCIKTAAQSLDFGNSVVKVAVVQRILQLVTSRSSHWLRFGDICTWLGRVRRPGLPESARRWLAQHVVLVGKPWSPRLCKDVALLSDLAHLAAQQNQLLPLSCSQRCVGFAAAQRISLGLACPGANAAFVATKLFCNLNGLAPNADQLGYLLAKLVLNWGVCAPRL